MRYGVSIDNSDGGTYLEHILTHGAIHTMLETLVFKVELNVVFAGVISNGDVKENFDGSLGDRSQFVRLTKLDEVPKRNIEN